MTLLATMLAGGWVACGVADDSRDDRLSSRDRRETREARAERDDRRAAAAESPGDRRETREARAERDDRRTAAAESPGDRRETREARAERDDRRTAEAESAGDQRERTGSLFQRLSSGGPTRPAEEPTRRGFRGFSGRDDHSDDIGGATALSTRGSRSGDIEVDGDRDVFSFRAERRGSYVIEARLLSHPDTIMELLDSDGDQIEYDDDGGNDGGSRIEWTAPDDGTYYVVVMGYGGSSTGTYELSLVDFRERLQSAVRISTGTSIESRLAGGSDADYFYFRADRGVSYVIEARLLSHPDTVMELLDSDGRRIESDDDGGTGGGSRIEWTAPDNDTYYVVVESYDSDDTGTYRLTLDPL